MVRLTVGKFLSRYNKHAIILDDQHRFAKMLILASVLHMILFLSFDFRASVPKLMANMIELQLSPPASVEIEYSQEKSDNLSKSLELQEGISFATKMISSPKKDLTLPRKRTISAASHEKRDLPYLSRWQSYVEQYGNTHYPDIALQNKLRGDLRLLVALNKDGSVHEVIIRHSSGSPQLDEAAVKLVYQASPFEPLPSEITQDTDILEIIRTWQFRGELTTS